MAVLGKLLLQISASVGIAYILRGEAHQRGVIYLYVKKGTVCTLDTRMTGRSNKARSAA